MSANNTNNIRKICDQICENSRNIRFSVIIPTHNRPELLKRAIESVLNQNFSDFEIVISDNNSTEENQKKAAALSEKDGRIHYIYNPKGGLARARNFGVKNSFGEIIVFLDDDDSLLKNYLKSVSDFFSENKDVEIVLVDSLRDEGKKLAYISPSISPPWSVFVGNGAAIKRSVFFEKNIYYDDELVAMEDIIFGFLAARHCKIALINKPLLIYNRVEGDASYDQGTNRYKWLEEQSQIVYEKYIQEYVNYGKKAGAWLNLAVGNLLASYGKMRKARPYLKRALQLQFRLSHLYYYFFSFFPAKVYFFAHHFKLFLSRLFSGYFLKNLVKNRE